MNLELRDESGGLRHYLDGRAVHCGDFIDVQLGGSRGPWVCVRYEASIHRDNGVSNSLAVCLYAVGGRIYYDQHATFRWPFP